MKPIAIAALALTSVMSGPAAAQGAKPDATEPAFRALYKEMVETDSSFATGSCSEVVDKMAVRLKAGGVPDANIQVFYPKEQPKAGNLVAVLPGTDPKAKAILMLGHIDVVNAKPEDWTRSPWKMIEENGDFYGRGVADMKAQSAIWTDTMIRYYQEGYKPRHTIKLALTCGEEGGGFLNGARWLTENHRDLIDAGFAMTEGGGGQMDANGKKIMQSVKANEKASMTFTFTATNPGGHSSRPRPDNAIYSLARAVDRLSHFDFPVQFNDANRGYFLAMSKIVGGETGAAMAAIVANPQDEAARTLLDKNPSYHAVLRTNCVATMMSAGHAGNALPQRATANINCRVMPGVPMDEVQATLTKVVNDPEISITGRTSLTKRAPPAPLTEEILGPIRQVQKEMWGPIPLVPTMSAGASDAIYMNLAGIPTYGVSGIFSDPAGSNSHGLNERIPVRSVMEARQYLYRLVKVYAEKK